MNGVKKKDDLIVFLVFGIECSDWVLFDFYFL